MDKKKIYEIFIITIILVDIILLTSITFLNVSPEFYNLIVFFDLCVVLILIPDFIYRLWKAEDKKHFLIHNWTDLLGMIPEIIVGPISVIFRYFRLVRIIRIIALFKKEIKHLLQIIHETKIDYVAIIIAAILIISGGVFFLFEHGSNPNVVSFSDALWYLLATITTVGYGDIYPTTDIGRVIAAFIMFFGIGFMSFITSTFTIFFMRKGTTEHEITHAKIDNLEKEIKDLKEIIRKIND